MPRTSTEWVMAVLGITGIALWYFTDSVAGLGLIAFVILIGIVSFTEVPAQPPSVAMVTFLGKREQDILLTEGLAFAFPGIEELIIVDYLPVEKVMVFDGVRCLLSSGEGTTPVSGGSVTVSVSIVFVPDYSDPERMLLFLNNGGKEKITEIIEGMLGEAIRQAGSTMTWLELTLAKSRLSVDLISAMTGMNLETTATPDQVKQHLITALTNGVADIRDLGIKVRRLNVIEVEPEGALKEHATLAADALLTRASEVIETETGIILAKSFQKASIEQKSRITFDRSIRASQIERGLVKGVDVHFSGKESFAAVAALLAGITKPSNENTKTPEETA